MYNLQRKELSKITVMSQQIWRLPFDLLKIPFLLMIPKTIAAIKVNILTDLTTYIY